MKAIHLGILLAFLFTVNFDSRAAERLAQLRVNDDIYSEVTITSVTATDIFFTHAKGMGNAKLKNLSPELQKRFGYRSDQAAAAEQKQKAADAQFRSVVQQLAARPQPKKQGPPDDSTDFVAPQLHAKSIRGQRAPNLVVSEWLTPAPEVNGKFVLVDFWATWCGPCRRSIPTLNTLASKFSDKLVVIGISEEPAAEIRRMADPVMNYAVASDPAGTTYNELQVQAIPHAFLIDPHGIVRFEGNPHYLTEEIVAQLIHKYENY